MNYYENPEHPEHLPEECMSDDELFDEFEQFLQIWSETFTREEQMAHEYFAGKFEAETRKRNAE